MRLAGADTGETSGKNNFLKENSESNQWIIIIKKLLIFLRCSPLQPAIPWRRGIWWQGLSHREIVTTKSKAFYFDGVRFPDSRNQTIRWQY
jgi:hypothetical protein